MLADLRSQIVSLLTLFAVLPASAEALLAAGAAGAPPAPWHVVGLPQQTKPFTRFSMVDLDGRRALKVEADESYGNLVRILSSPPTATHLAWQWRVERPLSRTDLRRRSGDDVEIKVCVFFDEPLDKLSFGERQVLRFARSSSAEPVPSATVCYVWDSQLPPGTAIDNAFTRRLRYIVLESGAQRLDQWVAERRDLAADFLRLFGDECDTVPPIIGFAVGADADNTHGHSIAYVADLVLEP